MPASTPLTVCHVFKTYLPDTIGGAEKVIEQICAQCDPGRVRSRVIALSPDPRPARIQRPEAEVLRFQVSMDRASTPLSLALLRGFAAAIEDADLLHYHFPWPFADLLHLMVRPRQPALVTYHSDIVRQQRLKVFYQPLMRAFLSRMERIVVTSARYRDSSEDLRPFACRTSVIPICLDERRYPAPPEAVAARWRRELGQDFFLFIGVLRYYKGLDVLLDAAQDTDLPVVVAGRGPLFQDLQRRCQGPGLANVRMTGFVEEEDKMALLQLCRAVVFPSNQRSEAFGVTLLEGAMAGKPLISTDLDTGTTFINKHEETGFVIPPDDPLTLREAMFRLQERDLAERMGQGARRRFERHFSAPRMGEMYTRLYEELAASRSLAGAP